MERVKGIEPSSVAWKATALPLSYTRECYPFLPRSYCLRPRLGSSSRPPSLKLRRDIRLQHCAFLPPHSQLDPAEASAEADGGEGWIRTSVGVANGFTVRPL